jgi:hypothetical protein
MRPRLQSCGLIVSVAGLLVSAAVSAQEADPRAWALAAAKGAFDLCRADAPDAAAVSEHGEVWGWPKFVPYMEHPKGYKREAGGQSRRTQTFGDKTSSVELGVQSGHVTSAAPAAVGYFRCDVATDQPINETLEGYFTGIYGAPVAQMADGTVWVAGKGALAAGGVPQAAGSDDDALAPVAAADGGSGVTRIELTRENGLDRARMTVLWREP